MKAVSCESLQLIDQQAIQRFSIPAPALMEIAGFKSFFYLKDFLKELKEPPLAIFFIGSGNNGGDGLVMARHLFLHLTHSLSSKISSIIVVIDREKKSRSELNQKQLQVIYKLGIPVYDYNHDLQKLKRKIQKHSLRTHPQIIAIDALLGIGAVSRPAEGCIAEMIMFMGMLKKKYECYTISLDIPSGVFYGFKSSSQNQSVTADITLTYGLCKDLFFYPKIRPFVGKLQILNPGFPDALLSKTKPVLQVVNHEMISDMEVPYRATDYKKTRGRIAVVAGKKGMLGAANLTVNAAWKSGAGLVTLFCDPADLTLQTRSLPHTMVYPYSVFDKYATRSLSLDFDTVILGSGLGRPSHKTTPTEEAIQKILVEILQQKTPIVIDADGIYYYQKLLLNFRKNKIYEKNFFKDFKEIGKAPVTLTPHVGEMRYLLSSFINQDPEINPFSTVKAFLKYYNLTNTLVVLKCHLNYILPTRATTKAMSNSYSPIDGYIVEGGNPFLGVGGSGDVLAGVIGARTAHQLVRGEGRNDTFSRLKGAVSGAYIHQQAGIKAHQKLKIFNSKELIKFIPQILTNFL